MINWFVELVGNPGFDPAIGWFVATPIMVITAIHFAAGFPKWWSTRKVAVFTILLAASMGVVYYGSYHLTQLFRSPPDWDDINPHVYRLGVLISVGLALTFIAQSLKTLGMVGRRILWPAEG